MDSAGLGRLGFEIGLAGPAGLGRLGFEIAARLGWAGWASKSLLGWAGPAGLRKRCSAGLLRLCVRTQTALIGRLGCFGWPLRLCLRHHWSAGCTASNFASCGLAGAVRRLCKSSIYIYIYIYIYIISRYGRPKFLHPFCSVAFGIC